MGHRHRIMDNFVKKRKKSKAKIEGQSGHKYVHNPDKIVNKETGLTKEQYVRSGERKKYRKQEWRNIGIAATGFGLMQLDKIKKLIK